MQFLQAIWFFLEIQSQKFLAFVTRKEYIFSFLAGASLAFIQAPFDFWWLIFPSFGLFYYLYAQTKTLKETFILGAVFGFGYHLLGLYWIGNALLVEGNDYAWAWPLAVVGLPLLLCLFTGIYTAIAHIIAPHKRSITGYLFLCSMLALAEWVRGYAFTGFPWNLYGYGWVNIQEIRQTVSLIGPYGLTFATILWGCSLGFLLLRDTLKWPVTIGCLFSLIAAYEYGHFRLFYSEPQYDPSTQIHLVQPNIPQAEKWMANKLGYNFDKHIEQSGLQHFASRNIIIWPETSIPPILASNPSAQERVHTTLNNKTVLLAGTLLRASDGYHNAITLWQKGLPARHLYSKSHLVPFGEYIPFQNLIPLKTVSNFSGFARGQGSHTISNSSTLNFLPLICYEIIFPQASLKNNGERPDYILTITNDAWYGNSPGPYQHFAQARFRAVESGTPIIRSANTGISGIIDPYGRVIAKTKLMEETSISVLLPKTISKDAYYRIYGDLLFFIVLTLFTLPSIWLKYRLREQ